MVRVIKALGYGLGFAVAVFIIEIEAINAVGWQLLAAAAAGTGIVLAGLMLAFPRPPE